MHSTVEGQGAPSGPVKLTLGAVRAGVLASRTGMSGIVAGGVGGAAVTVAWRRGEGERGEWESESERCLV